MPSILTTISHGTFIILLKNIAFCFAYNNFSLPMSFMFIVCCVVTTPSKSSDLNLKQYLDKSELSSFDTFY